MCSKNSPEHFPCAAEFSGVPQRGAELPPGPVRACVYADAGLGFYRVAGAYKNYLNV